MKKNKLVSSIKRDLNVAVPDYWDKINKADYKAVPPPRDLYVANRSNFRKMIILPCGIAFAAIITAGLTFIIKPSVNPPPISSKSYTSNNTANFSTVSSKASSSAADNSSVKNDSISENSVIEASSIPKINSEVSESVTMLKLPQGLLQLSYNQAADNEMIKDKIPKNTLMDYSCTVYYSADFQFVYTFFSKADNDGIITSEMIIFCQKNNDENVKEYSRENKSAVENDCEKYSDGQIIFARNGEYIFKCFGKNINLAQFADIVCSLYY